MAKPYDDIKLIETEICPRCNNVAIQWTFKTRIYIGKSWLSCFECGLLASWIRDDWLPHEVYTAYTDPHAFAALDLFLQPYS